MPVRCDEYDKVCVIGIDGDLSADNAAALRTVVAEQIHARHMVDFVLDFEKCPFIDSEGLESLLWMKGRCDELFGQMKLAAIDDNCRKILEMTRLEPRFECQADLAAALKMMR